MSNFLPNLDEFKPFEQLSEELKIKVKLFYLRDNSNAILVTTEDEVYFFGDICYQKSIDWQISEELSDKEVIDFHFAQNRGFALNLRGDVLSFGFNCFGELARGVISPFDDLLAPAVIPSFSRTPIVDMASGVRHSLALNSMGMVFGWGRNTFGQIGGKEDTVCEPKRVDINEAVKAIVCSDFGSLAVTVSGQVFSWGLNFFGDLGHKSYLHKIIRKPKRIKGLCDIEKVSTFDNNSYFLDKNGSVFACGQTFGDLIIKCQLDIAFNDLNTNFLKTSENLFRISKNYLIFENSYSLYLISKSIFLIDGKVKEKDIKEIQRYQDEGNDTTEILEIAFNDIDVKL